MESWLCAQDATVGTHLSQPQLQDRAPSSQQSHGACKGGDCMGSEGCR